MKASSEFSAGGLVVHKNKILMIKVKNLEGEIVWTFPKGHLEHAETPEQAAVREVEEEAGYKCAIERKIGIVEYFFKYKGKIVKKNVTWFLMKPIKKIRNSNIECLEAEWIELNEAQKKVNYKSDRKLLKKITAVNYN